MANMLYNGVELPNIDSVWTGEVKETHPYAYIRGHGGDEFSYELLFATQPFFEIGGGAITAVNENGVGTGHLYYYDSSEKESGWLYDGEFEGGSGMVEDFTDLWASHDILYYADNSVYLAASEPVDPNATSHVTTSSGNGFALYNGVKLPNISYAVPAAAYFDMYTLTSSLITADGVVYYVRVSTGSDTTFWVYTSSQAIVDEFIGAGMSNAVANAWFSLDFDLGPYSTLTPFWSNVDSSEFEGLVSDPISLQDMTVIEWDGDTTGLEVTVEGLYRVSDYSPASSAVGILNNNGVIEVHQNFLSPDADYWSVSGDGDASAWSSKDTGISFYLIDGAYTSLAAYAPASGESEPTYDRAAFLSGMAMGLTGKGYPAGGIGGASGMYSYNGTELPKLPTWDKATYPYAVIDEQELVYGDYAGGKGYWLYAFSKRPTYSNNTVNVLEAGEYLVALVCDDKYYSALEASSAPQDVNYALIENGWPQFTRKTETLSQFVLMSAKWTNTDILAADNSVYLAASEPTPIGGSASGNYLYNGVELPDINEVWTDKETYPYAVLLKDDVEDYILVFSPDIPYVTPLDVVYDVWWESGEAHLCWLSNNGTSWSIDHTDSNYPNGSTFVWSNCDVYNEERTEMVFAKSSAPVPAGGTDVFTKGYLTGAELRRKRVIPASTPSANGDGFALYNGVKLPNIDSVWADKVAKPYAIIGQIFNKTAVAFSSSPFVYRENDEGLGVSNSVAASVSLYLLDGGSWSLYASVDALPSFYYFFFPVSWCSPDVLVEGGTTTYLAASEPIPLDGMTVIEWDGDTTGLEGMALNEVQTLYKVAPYEAANNAVAVVTEADGSLSVITNFSSAEGTWNVGVAAMGVESHDAIALCVSDFGDGDRSYTSLAAYKPT